MASVIYRSPLLYHFVMRALHGRHFQDRYLAVSAEVPEGADVVELCAGDAWLYKHYLRPKGVKYLGLDNSPQFVRAAKEEGLDIRIHDAFRDPIPEASVVIMQASLHLFHANVETVISRMLDAAKQKVIIAEPIRNMSDSPNPLAAWIGRKMTTPHGSGPNHTHRYNPETFRSLMNRFPECERVFFEKGEREMVAVLKGRGARA
jgi:hypothetical protein